LCTSGAFLDPGGAFVGSATGPKKEALLACHRAHATAPKKHQAPRAAIMAACCKFAWCLAANSRQQFGFHCHSIGFPCT